MQSSRVHCINLASEHQRPWMSWEVLIETALHGENPNEHTHCEAQHIAPNLRCHEWKFTVHMGNWLRTWFSSGNQWYSDHWLRTLGCSIDRTNIGKVARQMSWENLGMDDPSIFNLLNSGSGHPGSRWSKVQERSWRLQLSPAPGSWRLPRPEHMYHLCSLFWAHHCLRSHLLLNTCSVWPPVWLIFIKFCEVEKTNTSSNYSNFRKSFSLQ